jgi:hypothetical protein
MDRWVGPHEQVLNVPIACRCYGPGKPSSWLSTEAFFPHCLIDCCGREAGYGPMDQTVVELWIVLRTLLFGGSESVQICWWLRERLLCVDHTRYVWSVTIRGLSVGCVWCVGQVFPYRVYIDSNRHDSRIWVSLVCGSHHIDNLMILMSLSIFEVCCSIHLIICNSCLIRVGYTSPWNDLNRVKTWK